MIFTAIGSENTAIDKKELQEEIFSALDKIGNRKKVLAIPPDISRYHSGAGDITGLVYDYFKDKLTDILPATGTHRPMTGQEIGKMYPGIPESLFRVHKWKKDLVTLGEVPAEFINEVSAQAR